MDELNSVAMFESTVINYSHRDKCIHSVIRVLLQRIFTCRSICANLQKQSIFMAINYRYSINCSLFRFFCEKNPCTLNQQHGLIFLFVRKFAIYVYLTDLIRLGLDHGKEKEKEPKTREFFGFQGERFLVCIKEEM